MSCPNYKCLCKRLIISQSVSFEDGGLMINLPEGIYNDGEKYCIIIAQPIPLDTFISAPLFFTIGDSDEFYPWVNEDYTAVRASEINTRTRYSTIVRTGVDSGTFVMTGKIPCGHRDTFPYIPIPTSTTTTTTTTTA